MPLPVSAAASKVNLCHVQGNGGFRAIAVSDYGLRRRSIRHRRCTRRRPMGTSPVVSIARRVGTLCLALENEESRAGAADAIRALVDAIVLEPDGERLTITLKGDFGWDAECCQRHEEVARYRRPHGPNRGGCGGLQPRSLPWA